MASGHAFFFEGHKAKLRGNDGHGLHGLLVIPALDMRLLCFGSGSQTTAKAALQTCKGQFRLS